MDLSIFTTPEAWISLITLIFLEIVLGVDNIVFISITSSRLPAEKQHIGRKLGLLGAMISSLHLLVFRKLSRAYDQAAVLTRPRFLGSWLLRARFRVTARRRLSYLQGHR